MSIDIDFGLWLVNNWLKDIKAMEKKKQFIVITPTGKIYTDIQGAKEYKRLYGYPYVKNKN